MSSETSAVVLALKGVGFHAAAAAGESTSATLAVAPVAITALGFNHKQAGATKRKFWTFGA